MKRFISGFIVGAIALSIIGVFAASYVANPAEFKVLVNGEEFVSDPPALVVEGRTYLPLRAIGEALGVSVNWNEELRQAEVGEIKDKVNTAIKIDGNVTVNGFDFSQLSVEKQEYIDTYICRVEVKNNSQEEIDGMMFSISFFNENDVRIGVAELGAISNGLKKGETKTATLYSSDDLSKAKTARYEIKYTYWL